MDNGLDRGNSNILTPTMAARGVLDLEVGLPGASIGVRRHCLEAFQA
jgi:hypothetical protein